MNFNHEEIDQMETESAENRPGYWVKKLTIAAVLIGLILGAFLLMGGTAQGANYQPQDAYEMDQDEIAYYIATTTVAAEKEKFQRILDHGVRDYVEYFVLFEAKPLIDREMYK